MLPFYNGYYWCTEIRKISNVPVVFISSADDNMNIVMAMNMGGDDFIAKPFDANVLTAKLQALLRRTYNMNGKIPVLEHYGVILNLNDTTLTYDGRKLDLTRNDFRILQTLMEQKRNNQEMIDYYSTWVHQIKVPIAVMRLILQSKDTKEHKELSYELFRIEQYVEMVLSYFRLDGSASDFIFKEYPLDPMIRQAIHKNGLSLSSSSSSLMR